MLYQPGGRGRSIPQLVTPRFVLAGVCTLAGLARHFNSPFDLTPAHQLIREETEMCEHHPLETVFALTERETASAGLSDTRGTFSLGHVCSDMGTIPSPRPPAWPQMPVPGRLWLCLVHRESPAESRACFRGLPHSLQTR